MSSLFFPIVKIAHALFLDFTKRDVAENKSQLESLLLPDVCIVHIDHCWNSCASCWLIHIAPMVTGTVPLIPRASLWELGKRSLAEHIVPYSFCITYWLVPAYKSSLDIRLMKMGTLRPWFSRNIGMCFETMSNQKLDLELCGYCILTQCSKNI